MDDTQVHSEDSPFADPDGMARELASAVEALVFAADEPVEVRQIASIFSEVSQEPLPSKKLVEAAVDFLNAEYERGGRILRIRRWAGGFRTTTTNDVTAYLKAFFRSDRRRQLSRSLMETLAVLCYKQPATKPEIDYVRGVDSAYTLRRLLDIGLISVLGRSKSLGRPILYGTTKRFLEEFGMSDLDELPNLREIGELTQGPAYSHSRAALLLRKGLIEHSQMEEGASK